MTGYIPKRGDVAWINFDPQLGSASKLAGGPRSSSRLMNTMKGLAFLYAARLLPE